MPVERTDKGRREINKKDNAYDGQHDNDSISFKILLNMINFIIKKRGWEYRYNVYPSQEEMVCQTFIKNFGKHAYWARSHRLYLNLFVQIFKIWSPGRAAGGKVYKVELIVRRLIHKLGYRFSLQWMCWLFWECEIKDRETLTGKILFFSIVIIRRGHWVIMSKQFHYILNSD